MTAHLPEHTWLTALTASQTRWVITGQGLKLGEIEQFIQQLVMSQQVAAFRLNDLTRKEGHYAFRVSFSLVTRVGDNTADGR